MYLTIRGPKDLSLPSLGAWIETINAGYILLRLFMSLPSLGAWIETKSNILYPNPEGCRSLHWERGLKHRFAGLALQSRVAPFIGSVD